MIIVWVAVLALSILLYVLLDGIDLGVGILLGLGPDEKSRGVMLSAVTPVWGSNETWLISAGVVLWGAFPVVYATLVSAFYLPALLMLAGLTLRSVALRFCYKPERSHWIRDVGCCGGSVLAAFMQGMMVGALVEGLPIASGRYTGGDFGWLSLFTVLCGLGLCFGYALLGACWLLQRFAGPVREQAHWTIPHLAGGLLAFFVFLYFYVLVDLQVMSRWMERPYLFVFPAIGAVTAFLLGVAARHERHRMPLYMAVAIFVAAFGTLAVSFWPYMIPFAVTIDDAAAPLSSLTFMLWTGVFVCPLMLTHVVINSVFGAGYRLVPHTASTMVRAHRGVWK
jgi:cytochrome bd ubiquinol oxidase subunit II